MKHFNGLTPAETERLAFLAEEMGEAIQAIGKILRHGYESQNPTSRRAQPPTNRLWLEEELGNVLAAIELMTAIGDADVDPESMEDFRLAKLKSVKKWMHHQ